MMMGFFRLLFSTLNSSGVPCTEDLHLSTATNCWINIILIKFPPTWFAQNNTTTHHLQQQRPGHKSLTELPNPRQYCFEWAIHHHLHCRTIEPCLVLNIVVGSRKTKVASCDENIVNLAHLLPRPLNKWVSLPPTDSKDPQIRRIFTRMISDRGTGTKQKRGRDLARQFGVAFWDLWTL